MRSLLYLLFVPISFLFQSDFKTFQSFDKTKIAYSEFGEGKAIILIHGYMSSRKNWENVPLKDDLVRAGYRIIIPDMRGMGDSDKPQNIESYADNSEVKDIIALADHLKLKKYGVVGYSRGSILTAKLLTMDKRAKKAVLGGMGENFTTSEWDRRKMFADIFSGGAENYPEGLTIFENAAKRGLDTHILGFTQTHQPVTSPEELAKVKIPVLIICGDQDRDNGDPILLKNMFSNSTFMETTGKHGDAYKTNEFSKKVLNFLK